MDIGAQIVRLTKVFPISRDPPEGGTGVYMEPVITIFSFQFLGIPPKGERERYTCIFAKHWFRVSNF